MFFEIKINIWVLIMKQIFLIVSTLAIVTLFGGLGYAKERDVTLDEMKQFGKFYSKEDNDELYEFWANFKDFDRLLASFSKAELKEYEKFQHAKLEKITSPTKFRSLKKYDLMAFQRAYPHLKPAFNNSFIRSQFTKIFQVRYSYGWKRWFAWSNLRLAKKMANEKKVGLAKINIEKLGQFSGNKENKSQGLYWLGFNSLAELALCHGYKPAVLDMVKASRVQDQVKLSALLSYMLMLRVKQNKMRVIFKGEWLKEIDAVLTEHQKQKYRSLIGDRRALREEISYCKA